jgi:signal transduction histidine kinase
MQPTRPDEPKRRRWARWTAIGIASFVPASIDTAHDMTKGVAVCTPCNVCSVVSVLVMLVALTATFDRCCRRRAGSMMSFALVGGLALVLAYVELWIDWAIQRATGVNLVGDLHRFSHPALVIVSAAFDGMLGLGLWAVAVIFPFAVRDANMRAVEADRLRTTAELARLRAHLQPHFLLNTLNTISGLAGDDPAEARRLVGALGDLLGDSLHEADEMQTLEAEMSWLQRYADILETRHRGMLTFRWDIAEGTRLVKVPRLLLQPLVENAVKHGALRRRGGGEVTVSTSIDSGGDRRVRCVIEDNGPGLAPRSPRPEALGIKLVTRRLALKYSGTAAFRLEASDGRTRSIVELPLESP